MGVCLLFGIWTPIHNMYHGQDGPDTFTSWWHQFEVVKKLLTCFQSNMGSHCLVQNKLIILLSCLNVTFYVTWTEKTDYTYLLLNSLVVPFILSKIIWNEQPFFGWDLRLILADFRWDTVTVTYSRQRNLPELFVQIPSAYIQHNVDFTFENSIVVANLDPLDLHGTITHPRRLIKYQYKQIYL